jgi:hypothetical protein
LATPYVLRTFEVVIVVVVVVEENCLCWVRFQIAPRPSPLASLHAECAAEAEAEASYTFAGDVVREVHSFRLSTLQYVWDLRMQFAMVEAGGHRNCPLSTPYGVPTEYYSLLVSCNSLSAFQPPTNRGVIRSTYSIQNLPFLFKPHLEHALHQVILG